MSNRHQPAQAPEDLAIFFVSRANDGDVDGLVALYEPDAVLSTGKGDVARGAEAIRRFYASLLEKRPHFEPNEQQPTLLNGGLALTSSRLANGVVTAEVARRQPDGSWRWCIDHPRIAKESQG
jgi:ketosteroid isomerase-like protein